MVLRTFLLSFLLLWCAEVCRAQAAPAAAPAGAADPAATPPLDIAPLPAPSAAPEPSAAPPGTKAADTVAMLALRASLTNLPPSWTASNDPCQWTGVACSGAGRVTTINASCTPSSCEYGQMAGTLPAALAGATALQGINLQGNAIAGTLPPELSALSSLNVAAFAGNRFVGPLPDSWGQLPLGYLSLDLNALTGPLPDSWGQLSRLAYLGLERNRLSLGFPSSWGNLSSLITLRLGSNEFKGPLPPSWRGMRALRLLSVRGMCGVCGGDPFVHFVSVIAEGSSYGWSCSNSNCYRIPLGFIGQAIIIAGIILLLGTMCVWRRVYIHRRRRIIGMSRSSGGGGQGADGETVVEQEVVPPAPPTVVLMPDGRQFCTARMDADWASAAAAAACADTADKPGGTAHSPGGVAGAPGSAQQQQEGPGQQGQQQQQQRWWSRAWGQFRATHEERRQQQRQQGEVAGVERVGSDRRPVHLQLAAAAAAAEVADREAAAQMPPRIEPVGSERPSSSASVASLASASRVGRRHSVHSTQDVGSAGGSWSGHGPAALRRSSTGQQAQQQRPEAQLQDPQATARAILSAERRTSRRSRRPVPIYDLELAAGEELAAGGVGAGSGRPGLAGAAPTGAGPPLV